MRQERCFFFTGMSALLLGATNGCFCNCLLLTKSCFTIAANIGVFDMRLPVRIDVCSLTDRAHGSKKINVVYIDFIILT